MSPFPLSAVFKPSCSSLSYSHIPYHYIHQFKSIISVVIASPPEDQTSSPVMERIGQWVRGLLVKFWIWLVAIMLFIFGIQGSEVVIFRIMYMVLFLIFTITFQVRKYVCF